MSLPYRSIVVLTGAGISAESGIQTFRSADGLWENHRIEEVATPEGFAANPVLVHNFYNQRRSQLLQTHIRPNAAHTALAKLEYACSQLPDHEFLLVTQNVDNLHERAGSERLIHMHGELLKVRCMVSGLIFEHREPVNIDSECRCCRQPGNLRPHIVWFGEMPLEMNLIEAALQRCDLLIAVGTSGQVYPAAGFYQTARRQGAHTIEINLETTGSEFDEHIYGLASTVVPDFVERLLAM
ncbi:Sir2 family NAD+-dependent deacetylase [Pseudohongiella spirulinae]|uniref:NAD-dependent protein deacylase n=1 Tax=Pseudohongiella spirulinae TaxID=1249552 RepID=A0A0S2KA25_9GAMM|nr:Sir2 family NAD+-dependent deacetylase [Pseudohongiella spirulinae]ALO45212.1 NAD-dependent protein deacylase [Pseudohongiella spirulinae]